MSKIINYDFRGKLLEVSSLFSRLSIDSLNKQWIQGIIDADFTEVSNLPIEFEDIHVATNFEGLYNAIKTMLRDIIDNIQPTTPVNVNSRSSLSFLSTTSIIEEDDSRRDTFSIFWINLSELFNIKALMSLLFYFIQRGQRYDANESTRELGIHCASIYFLLLALPGSNAYRVFHPLLYLKSLDILRLTTKLNIGAASPKKGGSRSSRMSHRQSIEDNDEDEDGELTFLNPAETNKLTRSLNILLNDFLRLVKRFSLKHSKESLDDTIAILVDVTRCEIHNAQGVFLNRHAANSVSSLAYNSYVAIQSICESLHGNVKKNLLTVMKYMLNNILMICRGASALSTRALGVIREHSIIFIKYLTIHLKEITYEAIYILIQHLCYKVPDKADFREKAARSVFEILKLLPIQHYAELLKWLHKFSHNDKAGHRLFTLEVISKLIAGDERPAIVEDVIECQTPTFIHEQPIDKELEGTFKQIDVDNSVDSPQNLHVLSHKFLLSIIFSRCRDSAATVRSKALHLLSECTLLDNPTIIESMKQIFFNKTPVVCTTPHIEDNQINCESPQQDLNEKLELPNAEMIMSMLSRRALDDKVTVRKSALQVVENLIKMNSKMLSTKNIKILVDHCRDPALFIRKQIITSITTITETYPDHTEMVKSWVSGILPLILDPELKVQEKVVENVHHVIFEQILPQSSQNTKLPWKAVSEITKLSYHKFLNKVLQLWSKSEYFTPNLIRICKTHIGHENNEQAWTLLALLSQYVSIKDTNFALDYFEKHCNFESEIGTYTLQQVLKVLRHSISHIPPERGQALHSSLLNPIVHLEVNVELISPMIDTITHISYGLVEGEEEGQKEVEAWASPILISCDEFLKKMLFPQKPVPLSKEEEELFFRYLYTLGDVAQLLPAKVNKRMFLMMQSIIFHQNHSNDNCTPPEIPSTQTQSSQPPSVSFTPTRRLKALAVVTLGKMCLQHEDQAKRIIPALGKLLDTTCLSSMKINIIFLLSDMCVRYATLVDPLMPQVTACLRDSDVEVRRTTLTLLITLLQEDYLKLKGSFFYRILQCLSDEEEQIRSTIEFYMTERLLKRFPKIFQQHFIECIFHYNCYEEHESYNKFMQSSQEKKLFSLSGAHCREQRMELYRFMLDHMPDDQRFATTQRLCEDVLGGVVDGRIKLTHSSLPMLEDTLMVLSSEEIKLAWLKSRPEDMDQPTDQIEQAEMAKTVVKKTIISQLVKKNVIENIVPILIALKQKLAEHRSPLTKQLLLYFKELMKDYKNEVKEILAGDKQLAKEIEFDLRKFEEEKEREEEEARSAQQQVSNEASPILPQQNSEGEANEAKPGAEPLIRSPSVSRSKGNRSSLLKLAIMNDKKTNLRMSFISEEQTNTSEDSNTPSSSSIKNCSVQLNRLSIATDEGTPVQEPEEGDSEELQEAGNDSSDRTKQATPEKDPVVASTSTENLGEELPSRPEEKKENVPLPTLRTTREELLRAISTPNQNKSVINNITFINRTEDFSAIGINASEISFERVSEIQPDESGNTLLVHFKSPKDDQFSRLRKSSPTRRKLCKSFKLEAAEKAKRKPLKETLDPLKTTMKARKRTSGGGFMESYGQDETSSLAVSLDSSSDLSSVASIKKRKESPDTSSKQRKRKSSSKRRTKR